MKSKIIKSSCTLAIAIAMLTSGEQVSAQSATNAASMNRTNDDAIYQKIDQQISQMTLEEKVGMIHANSSFTSAGIKRLNIPEWTTSDGPHGVRLEHGRDWQTDNDKVFDSATYLPTG